MNLQTDADLASFFDQCIRKGEMEEFDPEEYEKVKQLLEDWNIQPGQRLLEAGCGAGRLTVLLENAVGPEGEILGCDLSPEMIAFAKKRMLPDHVRFQCVSVLHTGSETGRYDKVICLNVFPHFLDKSATLREFRRILTDAGELWINHLCSRDRINSFHRHASETVSDHALPDEKEMQLLLEQAGFQIISLEDREDKYSLLARSV
ncbi:MAG: class I SAM-dependent methyltransferase [Candidatus Hydrogenedens sp.]|jgi:demethylmenaquinone methyltransferase/2-methoxy-6-polyprenyl-1,4-benzoquinol methylase|nr:class I SAM-dependent methyltransferase [Candidatus Hydrogenedens sp.]